MKKSMLFGLYLGLFGFLTAQVPKSYFLVLGVANGAFQDTRYSDVPYNGFGGHFGLGFERKSESNEWGARLQSKNLLAFPNHGASDAVNSVLRIGGFYRQEMPQWAVILYVGGSIGQLNL